MKTLYSDSYTSPIGEIFIAVDDQSLVFLDFIDNRDRMEKLLGRRFVEFELVPMNNVLGIRDRLRRYFSGDWSAFEGIDLSTGGTDFQNRVWKSLRQIPAGRAISYDQLACDIEKPKAIRAAASANANNPVAIIIPCHRVIGKDGSLRGYAGGVDRKAWLLHHEGAII